MSGMSEKVQLEILCTQRAKLIIEVEAMKAANVERECSGHAQAYSEKAFMNTYCEMESVETQLRSLQ